MSSPNEEKIDLARQAVIDKARELYGILTDGTKVSRIFTAELGAVLEALDEVEDASERNRPDADAWLEDVVFYEPHGGMRAEGWHVSYGDRPVEGPFATREEAEERAREIADGGP